MTYTFPPMAHPSVATTTGERFPVRRIFCVGQNYLAHVMELNGNPDQPPFFFTKPNDAVMPDGARIPYSIGTSNLHYEAELVVAIATGGANIAKADALNHIWGYAPGIDLTRRDIQSAARPHGNPWDMAKAFDRSAPCGNIHPTSQVGHLNSGHIRLRQNGQLRQDSDLSDMISSIPVAIAELSKLQELAPGDLIYTGTPSGIGPVAPGDLLEVDIAGLNPLSVTITEPSP